MRPGPKAQPRFLAAICIELPIAVPHNKTFGTLFQCSFLGHYPKQPLEVGLWFTDEPPGVGEVGIKPGKTVVD